MTGRRTHAGAVEETKHGYRDKTIVAIFSALWGSLYQSLSSIDIRTLLSLHALLCHRCYLLPYKGGYGTGV